MKALSLTQPWATLIALGAKTFETRSWETSYRGELLIHAAKAFPQDARDYCDSISFREALRPHGLGASDLPLGMIICKVELLACVSVHRMHILDFLKVPRPNVREIPFGDYRDGRFIWALRLVEVFNPPILAKGAQGLWNYPYETKNSLPDPEELRA